MKTLCSEVAKSFPENPMFCSSLKRRCHIVWLLFFPMLFSLSACVPNQPWRTLGDEPNAYGVTSSCNKGSDKRCGKAFMSDAEFLDEWNDGRRKLDREANDRLSIGFVEYSDRGNLFSRRLKNEVLLQVKGVMDEGAEHGAAIVVYVHGWHHNASVGDKDTYGFMSFLDMLSKTSALSKKKIVGIYVGWRGESSGIYGVNVGTYVGRKSAAEEIGKGGLTELLLSLERLIRCGGPEPNTACDTAQNFNSFDFSNKHVFAAIGHSFGGAAILSAVNELAIERMFRCTGACDQIDAPPFGNAVILLNPAIEANQMQQLKSLTANYQFKNDQSKLMHILTTRGDAATRFWFPIAQRLSNPTNRYATVDTGLSLSSNSQEGAAVSNSLNERALYTTTVGNFPPFWTAQTVNYEHNGGQKSYFHDLTAGCNYFLAKSQKSKNKGLSLSKNEYIERCPNNDANHNLEAINSILSAKEWVLCQLDDQIATPDGTPIEVQLLGRHQLTGHSDIFNPFVAAYTSTAIVESLWDANVSTTSLSKACATKRKLNGLQTNFGKCLSQNLDEIGRENKDLVAEPEAEGFLSRYFNQVFDNRWANGLICYSQIE